MTSLDVYMSNDSVKDIMLNSVSTLITDELKCKPKTGFQKMS